MMLEAQNVCTACRLLFRHACLTPEAEKLLPQHGELHPLHENDDKLWWSITTGTWDQQERYFMNYEMHCMVEEMHSSWRPDEATYQSIIRTILCYVEFKVLTADVTKNSACHLIAWLILRHWWWRRHVPPKRRLTFNGLQGVISQTMEFSLVYAHSQERF
jgi:hypothetical protein